MQEIILLHANAYTAALPAGKSGFEGVKFPVKVQAEPYRFNTDGNFTLDSLMVVSNDELVRIGYTGPLIDGGLNFAEYNNSFRRVGPFDFWNALKSSRDAGELPA